MAFEFIFKKNVCVCVIVRFQSSERPFHMYSDTEWTKEETQALTAEKNLIKKKLTTLDNRNRNCINGARGDGVIGCYLWKC